MLRQGKWDYVADTLVAPFVVVESQVFPKGFSQLGFTGDDEPGKALFLERSDEPFGVSIEIGAFGGKLPGFDALTKGSDL